MGRGRLVVLAMLAGYFVLLAGLGGHSEWSRLGVPPLTPAFADLRSITSGWECTREGVPVLERNPCDPIGERPANYPRVWTWLSVLGLGQEITAPLGVALAVLFFAVALVVLPRAATAREGAVYGLAACSPAVMLGVERGNVDLALFALVAVAVFVLHRGTIGRSGAHVLILLAAILKLFPIFAAMVLVRRPSRRALLGAGAVLAAFALYAAATIDDVRTIARVVPQGNNLSYGIRRLTEPFVQWVDATSPWLSGAIHERLTHLGLDLLLVAFVVTAAVALRLRAPVVFSPDGETRGARRDLDLFWAGAGVYVLSYALFRSWDYRLAFALLTIPQLLRWLRERPGFGAPVIAALLAALWLDAQPYWLPLAGARDVLLPAATAAQFLLFAGYVAALVGTFRLEPEPAPASRASAAEA